MAIYIVSYDLNKNQDHSVLISRIKEYDNFKILNNCFVIKTNDSVEMIYNTLKALVNEKDEIFIGALNKNYMQGFINSDFWTWVNK